MCGALFSVDDLKLKYVKDNLPVFTMDYPRIQIPFEVTLWILLASFAKIGFHVYHKVTVWVPESCLLITIGLIVGAIMHSVQEEPPAVLTSNVFLLYMLPPIVLDSGYFMPTRPFFENIGTVLWFAVVGTLWNSIGIGMSLFAICQIEAFGVQDINLQENLLFASIISAVDPVAVLSVFEDVSVNENLYIVVFGESLFSDAVTVVLYNMFNFVADMPVVEPEDVFLGVANFFVVGLGGIVFGILFGFVSAFTTRFTSKVREIEPLFIFMYSYLAYLVAELFAISSIMAIVTCALTMKYYVEENVSQRSCTTIRHVVKMLGSISETLIFFFLGVVTLTTEHEWNWAYILFTLLFYFIVLGVVVLIQIINPFRTIPFNLKDQLGLAYGGLRGAISFALAFTLPDNIGRKKLFITATIAIILFTVFLQGISIRPLIEYINVRRTNRNLDTINVEVHCRLMEHTIAGIEDLCGQWSRFYWKDKFLKFNNRILRKILIRDSRAESSIVALYKKLELQDAMEILDNVAGDISAAPSIVSLYEEKKNPKPKTFMASDLRNMHNILSKNMYNIRQRTVAFTRKHALPNDQHTKEILIRRHASIRRSLRPGSFQTSSVPRSQKYFSLPAGQNLDSRFPPRRLNREDDQETMSEVAYSAAGRRSRFSEPRHPSSSRAMMPMHRLDTLKEATSVDVLNENKENSGRAGTTRSSASSSGSRVPVPCQHRSPTRAQDDNGHSDNVIHVHHEAEDDHQPASPPPAWAVEPRDTTTRNPLLRRPQWNPKK
uniref:Sodium/hydrogen exchanger n=1 Tax=Neogobius melanostomus TaxID=47308 RepID=A0A8C6WUE0_9GOBI